MRAVEVPLKSNGRCSTRELCGFKENMCEISFAATILLQGSRYYIGAPCLACATGERRLLRTVPVPKSTFNSSFSFLSTEDIYCTSFFLSLCWSQTKQLECLIPPSRTSIPAMRSLGHLLEAFYNVLYRLARNEQRWSIVPIRS